VISTINLILIYAVLATSLTLLLGFAGQVSLAQAAFAGVAGYLASYLAITEGAPFLAATAAGIVAAMVFGLLVGIPALALTTDYLILLTLAVQTTTMIVITTIPALGGVFGLVDVPAPNILGKEFTTPEDFLLLTGVSALWVIGTLFALLRTEFGRVLKGIGEDEVATQSLGKNLFGYKLIAFALAAGIAGFGGVLLAYYNSVVTPQVYGLNLSISIIVIVVLGGAGNLAGAILGSVLVVGTEPVLRDVVDLSAEKASTVQLLLYGLVLIAVLMIRPQGILPERVRRRRRRLDTATADGDDGERAGVGVRVTVSGLSKRFGSIDAVKDLDVVMEPGRITGLIGPNGAGKTTLFSLLTGAVKADAGTISLGERDVTGWSPNKVAKAGMVRSFQNVRVYKRMTVFDNVRLAAPTEGAAVTALRDVGLLAHADELAGNLAFGEQKLVAIARIISTQAPVLLLDEPTSGVDAVWVDRMVDVIAGLRRPWRTICVVEHNLEFVSRLADHVYFMENGRVTAAGGMQELVSDERLTEAYFGVAP
jgi:branched-chain amino acid transport system permease protein